MADDPLPVTPRPLAPCKYCGAAADLSHWDDGLWVYQVVGCTDDSCGIVMFEWASEGTADLVNRWNQGRTDGR